MEVASQNDEKSVEIAGDSFSGKVEEFKRQPVMTAVAEVLSSRRLKRPENALCPCWEARSGRPWAPRRLPGKRTCMEEGS